jgi:hypothetical protein
LRNPLRDGDMCTAASGPPGGEGEPIVDRPVQRLFAPDVFLGRLDGCCPSRNWICSSSPPAAWHNLAQVLLRSWGANFLIPTRAAQSFTTYQTTFWVIPPPHTAPFFWIERNSLPFEIEALSLQRSTAFFTQAGTDTVRTWPAFPTRSTIAQ